MQSRHFTHLRAGLTGLLAFLIVAALPASSAQGQVVGPEADAIMVCVTAPGNAFNFVATDGYIGIPDGNTVYMWGFALEGDANGDGQPDFQHPGPNVCVAEGSIVTINVTNTLPEPVSIIFPGQSNVTASGGIIAPNSLAQAAAASGGTVSYTFVANQAGTFLYESGTNLQKQVKMGLFGSLVVRPSLGNDYAYDSARTQFSLADEYMMLLSEIDPELNAAVEQAVAEAAAGGTYNDNPFPMTDYHPRYWLINGRAFPDTIAPNFASWLPTQPYGALLHIEPRDPNIPGAPPPAIERFLNVGTRPHPIHPHGDHVLVIGRDGNLLEGPAGEDLSFNKFDVNVGPGQTWDVLYDWTDVNGWHPTTNPLPTDVLNLDVFATWLNPRSQNLLYKDPNFYSGSPYLGYQGNKDIAAASYNECGEYYQIWHSHALNEAANYEAGFGGMITLERIDPPGGCP